jgi:hypothetical protein
MEMKQDFPDDGRVLDEADDLHEAAASAGFFRAWRTFE